MTNFAKLLVLLLAALATPTFAQQLPKALSGRYNVVGGAFSQTFALHEIAQDSDSAFKAKLTWWTSNARCAVKEEPIAGRVTASWITFEFKTKCDVGISVQLERAEKGWAGRARTTVGTLTEAELKAE